MPTKVNSVEELKQLAQIEDGREFFILLNGNVRSVKRIEWDPPSQSFCIINQIDDTHQDLTEQQLATDTNIVAAINKGAFFLKDRCMICEKCGRAMEIDENSGVLYRVCEHCNIWIKADKGEVAE